MAEPVVLVVIVIVAVHSGFAETYYLGAWAERSVVVGHFVLAEQLIDLPGQAVRFVLVEQVLVCIGVAHNPVFEHFHRT